MKLFTFLLVLTFSISSLAQEATPVESPTANLRDRNNGLQWKLSGSNQKSTNNKNTTETDVTYSEVQILYMRNFGRFEVGGGYSSKGEKDEKTGTESRTTSAVALGHFNFIVNEPGHDFIPYLSATIGALSAKSGSSEYSGAQVGFGGGLSWFPVSEILAVTAEIGLASAKITGSTPTTEITLKQAGVTIGWAFYF